MLCEETFYTNFKCISIQDLKRYGWMALFPFPFIFLFTFPLFVIPLTTLLSYAGGRISVELFLSG